MKLDLIFQMDNKNELAYEITETFKKEPKKAYFFCGNIKDSGFRILEEEFIDRKTKIFFAMGIDKKNTTRGILEDILRYTKDVYYFSNNKEIEFNSNIFVFECTKEAVMYSFSGSISDSLLKDDILVYTKVIFDLEDDKEAKEYKDKIRAIVKTVEKEKFEKLTKEKIEELIDSKEIFSNKQYVHNVKSISELLGKKEEKDEEKNTRTNEEIFGNDVKIPKIDLSGSDIDIEFDDIELVDDNKKEDKGNNKSNELELDITDSKEIQDLSKLSEIVGYNANENDKIDKNSELYDKDLENFEFNENDTIDINDLLFSKADIKLEVDNKKTQNKKEEKAEDLVKVKKLDLNNVSNYIYELPSRGSKGQDLTCLKIPNYIQLMIPSFFELTDKGKNIDIDGINYKMRNINLEIVDVKNSQKYTDRDAKIMHKSCQTYIKIDSDQLKNVQYSENDIARIIKLSSDVFHIEIISKDLQEYKLWSKLCTQNFKSSNRKYGVM